MAMIKLRILTNFRGRFSSKPTCSCQRFSTSAARATFVLSHIYMPPKTPDGEHQRPPHELQNLQKYSLLENLNHKAAPPINVILLDDIENLGSRFDVVEVSRRRARYELIPLKKACYASPFDLQYYAQKKERLKDELSKRMRIPYDYLILSRRLMSSVTPIFVSLDNKWTLDLGIIVASLLQAGIEVHSMHSVHLPDNQVISGPSLEDEARLIRFYYVINNQMIVPLLGRLLHIATGETKANLYPGQSKPATDDQLLRSGLVTETFYFHPTATINTGISNIGNFMSNRAREEQTP